MIRPQSAELAPWAGTRRGSTVTTEATLARSNPGRVKVGEEVVVLPRCSHTHIEAIDTPDGPLEMAVAGQSVVVRLATDVDVSRGDILAAPMRRPPLSGGERHGLLACRARPDRRARVLVQHGTSITKAIVRSIDGVLDLDLAPGELPCWVESHSLALNDIGRVRLALAPRRCRSTPIGSTARPERSSSSTRSTAGPSARRWPVPRRSRPASRPTTTHPPLPSAAQPRGPA